VSAQRLTAWLIRLESGLALALLTFVVVTNAAQVFWRSVLGDPLSWTEEAARVAFIWVVYVGVVRAVRRRTHLSVDFFVRRLPSRWQARSARFNHLLCIGFFTLFFVQAIRLTWHTAGMSLAVLPLPAASIYAAGVVCGALSLLHLALQLREAPTAPRPGP
jgi:TRAP-type transport system small permease protein